MTLRQRLQRLLELEPEPVQPPDTALAGGEAATPETLAAALPAALASPDPVWLRQLAQVARRFNTPASRQLLVDMIRNDNLFARAAALRAFRPAPNPAQAAILEEVVQHELQLARQLLHGQATAPDALASALAYEVAGVRSRLFGLLIRLYSPQLIAEAQHQVAHATHERQADALEMLAHLLPPSIYRGLQALLETDAPAAKAQALDALLGPPPTAPLPVAELVAVEGLTAFADWTLAQALQAWKPTAATVQALLPHLRTQNRLVRESAFAALRTLSDTQPAVHQALLHHWPAVAELLLMPNPFATARVSAAEQVHILKHTALFADTPEHVLSAIVPIMNEVRYGANELIFAKGEPGTSLFIIYEGEVGVYNGSHRLTSFGKGDFFGELALLDGEPRSASVHTESPVLAFRLDQDDFYDVMEDRPEVLRNVLRVLCQRLRIQNEKLKLAAKGA